MWFVRSGAVQGLLALRVDLSEVAITHMRERVRERERGGSKGMIWRDGER